MAMLAACNSSAPTSVRPARHAGAVGLLQRLRGGVRADAADADTFLPQEFDAERFAILRMLNDLGDAACSVLLL